MGRRKKLINNTTIPQHQIEAIARCILPDILAFYESEEGQREFTKWQERQAEENKKPCAQRAHRATGKQYKEILGRALSVNNVLPII